MDESPLALLTYIGKRIVPPTNQPLITFYNTASPEGSASVYR
ncbi:hypothetical protein SAMN05660206_105146 [Sphingobacterium wenxiniae]|uniref:Uncharacterized protein n=1 Tax=Sphingobacterium wenxiniae TaxID=683125 RepID=A0A1I6SYD3_9SPHI|nr:hypothetical protein SAMN05660206_105146 [Sphingobacterium wenxiniae]